MVDNNIYIMWLNSIVQINLKNRIQLMEYFGGPKQVWDASSAEISRVIGFSSDDVYKLIRSRDDKNIEKLLSAMEKAGARFVSFLDEEYPQVLREIPLPPLGFYILGKMPSQQHFVGVVGSRNCTEYGSGVSYSLAKTLAQNDVVVVSGMADGVDGYAHRGALNAGGKTVAVMGTGIDLCYPSGHYNLKQEIAENGCVISEYPPGMRGTAFTFPQRNRIISGLSKAVVVVEATKRSGSLITADHALSQGREVFAVPGNITGKSSEGSNLLIRDGATPMLSAQNVLDFLGIKKQTKKEKNKNLNNSLAPNEKLVYDCIDLVPQAVDQIAAKTGLATQTLQSTLAMLEIKGQVQKLSGQRYVRSQ